jgi:hypothetical protein
LKLFCKAIADRAQLEARLNVPSDGVEILLRPQSLDTTIIQWALDHFPEVAVEVGDRLEEGLPVDPLNSEPHIRDRSRAYLERVLELADRMGLVRVTVHLVAKSRTLSPHSPPMVYPLAEAMEGARQYYTALGPRLVLENTLLLDPIGNDTVAYCGLGKTLWDFVELGLPFCLDVAHLGVNLKALKVAHEQGTDVLTTDQGPYRLRLTDREESLGRTLFGQSLTEAFLSHLEVLSAKLLRGVHLSNCRGFGLNGDGWLDGELDLVLILERLVGMDPDYLVPEIRETDYIGYPRNRLMLDVARGVLSRCRDQVCS